MVSQGQVGATASLTPMRSPVSMLVVPLVLLLGASLAGCSGEEADDPPEPAAVPLSEFDAGGVTVARTDFCDRIPEVAVERAVGDPAASDSYGNGESAPVDDATTDIAHEFNCSFTGESDAVARVWVFVPQVTRARAKALVAEAGSGKGCHNVPGQGFGKPSTGTVCRTRDGAEASYRGLFVDSWLACSVSDPDRKADEKELLDRAGTWCVQAVSAAATE